MAVQFSPSSINWTDATWQTVDSTSYLKSEAGSTTTTTSYVASQAFTPGIITVEGILLRIKGTTTTPTGTLSVQLWNSTGSAQVAVVTCNANDILNNNTSLEGGWMYFKFGTPQTLLAATAYSIRIKSSVNATVTVYRDGTAGNWSRGLVTSTTASLSASDDVIICGNVTAAATTTVNTVTYDYTGADAYNSVEVGAYGKMICQNSSSTNYKLTINSAGFLTISHNGIFEMCSSSSRLNSSSTFILTMTCATNGANYIDIRNYGTFRCFGATKIRRAKLAADLSIGGTSITTNISTGWKTGDLITITGTEGQYQQRTLVSDASGTTVPITASTYNTKGTSPTIADVINNTSNFKILGSSALLCTSVITQAASILDIDNIEFQYVGYGAAVRQYGITINTTALGSCNIKDCSFANAYATNGNCYIYATTTSNGFTIDGCVMPCLLYGVNGINSSSINPTLTTTIKNCVVIGLYSATGIGFYCYKNYVVDNCIVAHTLGPSGQGFSMTNDYTSKESATISNLIAYWVVCGLQIGISTVPYNVWNTDISNITIWRCTSYGIQIFGYNNSIDGLTMFGNTNANIYIGNCSDIKIKNANLQCGVTKTCNYGIVTSNTPQRSNIIFENSSFGTTTSHISADIVVDSYYNDFKFINCSFGSSNLISQQSFITPTSKISFQRFNGNANSHKVYKKYGTLFSDTVIYDTSSISLRLTPTDINLKLKSTSFQIAVASGSTATVSIKVRKSVLADGTAYDGAQPRLILKSNPSAGSSFNTDIVCATASAAAGTWETLSYTLPSAVTDNVGLEFYVDCDGTTGWINVDTFVSNNNNSMKYYNNGEPINDISTGGGEKSFTFVG